jgi:hypothetical protein
MRFDQAVWLKRICKLSIRANTKDLRQDTNLLETVL